MTNPHACASRPCSLDLGNLEKLTVPMYRVLADFTQGCSTDPNARTVAVTTLVISFWQLAGRGMSHSVPSLILLNASETAPDPINDFASRLVNDRGDTGPRVHREGAFAHWEPKFAPAAMAQAIVEKHRLGIPTPQNLPHHEAAEERFFAASATGFGTARTRSYSTAWHETFNLLTNRNDEILLRLESEDDFVSFRQHLLTDTKKLSCPTGYGAGLVPVVKHVTISGSLPPEQWNAKIATKMVELGLPILVLPHISTEPPAVNNLPGLDLITSLLPRAFHSPVEEPANLLPGDWFDHYGSRLRERLRELPGTYEYSIQRMARQLFPVCKRLAILAGRQSVGSSRVDLQACKLEYSIVSPK